MRPQAKWQKRQLLPDIINQHITLIYQNQQPATSNDFDAYIAGARSREIDVKNVIAWWAKQERHTPLTQLALDVLSIPAISTECE